MRTTLLLVEDNPGDAMLTTLIAEDAGLVVGRHVESLADALAALTDAPADVVLLDLGLPDADGSSGVEQLVEQHDVPVIVLTGADADHGAAAVSAGAQDYLRKGEFDADRLGLSVEFARRRHDTRRLLRSHAEALERANQRLAAFTSVVAHDLRSPLVNAEQWTKLVRNGQAPDLDDAMERIARNLRDQFTLIDNLLTVYRGHELHAEHVDLATLVDDVVAETGTQDVIEVGPLPDVTAAPAALRAVVVNLVRNAVDHATMTDRGLQITIEGRRLDDEVILRVDDNGPGIPRDMRESIFVRGRTSSPLAEIRAGRTLESGFGIGLAGARDAIEAMRGLLWVEDGTLGGACFVLVLPAADVGDAADG